MTFSISKTRELCDAATEGPWKIKGGANSAFFDRRIMSRLECVGFSDGHDAAFIAHARTALPQALDEIEEAVRLLGDAYASMTTVGIVHDGDVHEHDPLLETIPAFLSRHKEG